VFLKSKFYSEIIHSEFQVSFQQPSTALTAAQAARLRRIGAVAFGTANLRAHQLWRGGKASAGLMFLGTSLLLIQRNMA